MTVLLQALSDALGVSGNEQEIRDLIYREVKDLADEIRVDAIGNLIAVKRARRARAGDEPWRVMIAAHMDEVGFMVKQIDGSGMLKFAPVGGIDPRVVLGKPVLVGKNRIAGIIGVKPIHLQESDESRRVIAFDQLTIDVGASGKDELDGVVRVGDYAAFNFSFQELDSAPDGLRTVMGKALDDRAGCAVLIELLKSDYPFDLHAVFTVQEEVGLRGARVAAYAINPRMAFVLETTVCDDLPKKKDISRITRMGAGPAITISDRSVVAAKGLVRRLVATAEKERIPYQIKSPNVGGTDAGAIHLAQSGIPSAVVSMPCRYLHSMVTMLSLNDFDKVVQLMRATLQDLTPDAADAN
jgi:tetrahedral aminopeptidase